MSDNIVPLEHHASRETVQAAGRRNYRRNAGETCSTCHTAARRPKQRTCKSCHATYERDRRIRLATEFRRLKSVAEGMKE